MEIKEMSLTGNMENKEMWQRKIQWKYADKTSTSEDFPQTAVSYDMTLKSIDLEPQRIRVFSIKWATAGEDTLFLN